MESWVWAGLTGSLVRNIMRQNGCYVKAKLEKGYCFYMALSLWLLTLGDTSQQVMRTPRQCGEKSTCRGNRAAYQQSGSTCQWWGELPWKQSCWTRYSLQMIPDPEPELFFQPALKFLIHLTARGNKCLFLLWALTFGEILLWNNRQLIMYLKAHVVHLKYI